MSRPLRRCPTKREACTGCERKEIGDASETRSYDLSHNAQPPLRRILRSSRLALDPSNGPCSVIQPTAFPSTDRMSSGTPCSDTEACRSPDPNDRLHTRHNEGNQSWRFDRRRPSKAGPAPDTDRPRPARQFRAWLRPRPPGPIRPGLPARFRRYRHRDIPPHRSLRPTPNPETPSSAAQNSEARFRLAKSQTPRCPSQSLNAEIPFCHLATQFANRANVFAPCIARPQPAEGDEWGRLASGLEKRRDLARG